jgi:hypothetical protein
MNPSLEQLAITLLWSENDNADESGGEPLDANYSVTDIDEASLQKLHKRFQSFVERAEQLLTAKFGGDWSSIDDFYIGASNGSYQTEHDYILTVNGHGVGFWEKHDWQEAAGEILTALAQKETEIHAYVGDDGKICLE